ncbi:glycosyltransferase [Microbacterium ulmi]|uniref:D-inositol 3-phosphate glycosyltransferase n=1 Tax=Microbacterium ulmi TaxID=179095 RepID=A0A7Y2LYN0_9MICO|nr:glycosyltransferase involved in cell wall biosynthesis [Microbacterium ulmi]NNH03270.1 glycosyltransferase family 4 protein [Microbacterium ulmi]
MRIALATSSYPPYFGGVEEHVRNVARQLTARGHEVVVWTVARDGRFAVREVDGIEVWDLPAPLPSRSAAGVLRFLVRLPRAVLAWLRAARSARPEVIHVHCFGPNGTYARLLAGLGRTPLVLTAHGETLMDDGGVFDSSALARASLRAALTDAAAVTACSQVVVVDLEQRFGLAPGRGRIVWNGIDPDEPIGEKPAGVPERYIAAIGRLVPLKGFDLLVDAFAAADLPEECALVIGGGGTEAEALRARAIELGVSDRVILPGRLDRPSVSALLSGAAVSVMPSRFEAFGIAALEAWRAGVPLLATTRGGPPEFVTDGQDGLLRDPEDTPAFARALTELLADREAAARLAQNGHARIAAFTWEATASGYESIYRDVSRPPVAAARA